MIGVRVRTTEEYFVKDIYMCGDSYERIPQGSVFVVAPNQSGGKPGQTKVQRVLGDDMDYWFPDSALELAVVVHTISDEELKRELSRREEEKKKASIPKPIPDPDFTNVIAGCISHLERIAECGYCVPGEVRSVYQILMVTVFGPGIWDQLNEIKECALSRKPNSKGD